MKFFLKFFFTLFILILILIGFLPQILSSRFAKPFIEKTIFQISDKKISYENLQLSWFGPQKIENLNVETPKVSFSIEHIFLEKDLLSLFLYKENFAKNDLSKKGRYHFTNLHLKWLKKTIPVDLLFTEGFLENEKENILKLSLKGGSQKNPLSIEILKNYKTENLEFNISLQKFPVELLDPFSDYYFRLPLSKMLDSPLDLKTIGFVNPNEGKIDLDARCKNCRIKLSLDKEKEFYFLRNQPLTIEYIPSNSFFTIFHESFSSFFKKPFQAHSPILLTIHPSENTKFSLPFSLDNLQFLGQLYLSHFTAKEGSTLKLIMSLLNKSFSTQDQEVDVLATPIDFSLQKGLLKLDRFDFLLDNHLHMCSFGSINLKQEKLDLILGIPEDSLRTHLGLKNFPEDFVLQIPLKGSLHHPRLKKKEALAKLALLTLLNQKNQKSLFFLSESLSQKETPKQKYALPKEISKDPLKQKPSFFPLF